MAPRTFLFDFNGTLSDDEPILCAIFRELFGARGRELSAETYFGELAGLSDPEIVRAWLGLTDEAEVKRVVDEKIARYRIQVADGSSVSRSAREAVRLAAANGAAAVVSGAAREEVEPVLVAAGLRDAVAAVVTADEFKRGKPDPEGYLRALAILGAAATDAIAFEDSEAGVGAARAAGIRCIAVLGTMTPARLEAADEIVPRLDAALVRRLLESG
ncbi:MAG TPA: HAD family phosphatase [Gaiellaceae bacterium]